MAAAAAAARAESIADVMRLRVHVLNPPETAAGSGTVRSGGRQQTAIVQLLTTMSPQSDIYHLKVSRVQTVHTLPSWGESERECVWGRGGGGGGGWGKRPTRIALLSCMDLVVTS